MAEAGETLLVTIGDFRSKAHLFTMAVAIAIILHNAILNCISTSVSYFEMTYQLPWAIAEHFTVSLKTVYNHLSKHRGKIRIRKEHWKTFVHFEDFEKLFLKSLQTQETLEAEWHSVQGFWNTNEGFEISPSNPLQFYKEGSENVARSPANHQLAEGVWTFESEVQKLQSELQSKADKEAQLQKHNLALQDQLSKYGLLLSDEKVEKKDLFEKYVGLQSELQTKTETFGQQRTKLAQRLYLFIGLSIALTIAVFALLLPYLLNLRKQ